MASQRITVHPDRLRALGSEGAPTFVILTNPGYVELFAVEPCEQYPDVQVVSFEPDGDLPQTLANSVPDGAHILTILPDCLLHSVPRDVLGSRKLLIMACRSGRTDRAGIEHFLRCGEQTDPEEQEEFADAFFAKGQQAQHLTFIDPEYGTSATFRHLSEEYEWHEQLGFMEPGDQQVFPSGEIACFLVPLKAEALDSHSTFAVDGTFAVRGQVIVQSGPPSFLESDQERIFSRLATAEQHAILLHVEHGDVTGVEATHAHCRPGAEMLESMFEVDSRFGRIYEFGFAFNRHVVPWPGNSAMNEVCGGERGQVHVGLGMLPHTQYHLDMFLAGTEVRGGDDEVIFGGNLRRATTMTRRRASMCPCLVTV